MFTPMVTPTFTPPPNGGISATAAVEEWIVLNAVSRVQDATPVAAAARDSSFATGVGLDAWPKSAESSPPPRWTSCHLRNGRTRLKLDGPARGTTSVTPSGQMCSPLRTSSALSAVPVVTERLVRFTDQFFDRLGLLLPEERGADGTPSITDFLMLDLPFVRDELAQRYEERTLNTDDADVRVYIGNGTLVRAFAVYATLSDDTVDVFWVSIDFGSITIE